MVRLVSLLVNFVVGWFGLGLGMCCGVAEDALSIGPA